MLLRLLEVKLFWTWSISVVGVVSSDTGVVAAPVGIESKPETKEETE